MLDYFGEFMANSPARMSPDYGLEFRGLEVAETGEYPVTVTLLHTAGPQEGQERIVRAKYVVGADGARSKVRESIGCTLAGDLPTMPGASWTCSLPRTSLTSASSAPSSPTTAAASC